MLVSGAGDIKLTKDGNTLLHEMQIQHPTAMMIARIATAQDDITGDGTTSAVLIVGELMKQAERHLSDGVHPRLLCEGIELAKERVLEYIDKTRIETDTTKRDLLVQIAQASLRTKMHKELADLFTEIVVDAVLCIKKPDESKVDLHMIEVSRRPAHGLRASACPALSSHPFGRASGRRLQRSVSSTRRPQAQLTNTRSPLPATTHPPSHPPTRPVSLLPCCR